MWNRANTSKSKRRWAMRYGRVQRLVFQRPRWILATNSLQGSITISSEQSHRLCHIPPSHGRRAINAAFEYRLSLSYRASLELCCADLQHGFDGFACKHVSHSIVNRCVRIVPHQPINRQLAGTVEFDQSRQKGLHVAFALHTTAHDAALLKSPHLQGHIDTGASAAYEASCAARCEHIDGSA